MDSPDQGGQALNISKKLEELRECRAQAEENVRTLETFFDRMQNTKTTSGRHAFDEDDSQFLRTYIERVGADDQSRIAEIQALEQFYSAEATELLHMQQTNTTREGLLQDFENQFGMLRANPDLADYFVDRQADLQRLTASTAQHQRQAYAFGRE